MRFDTEKTAIKEDGLKIEYGLIRGNNRVVTVSSSSKPVPAAPISVMMRNI
jgi:hypothetical protein